MSLESCLKQTKEFNTKIRQARTEEEIAHLSTKEVLADGLPQINASSQLVDNIELAQVILPGSLTGGEDMKVSMGSKLNFQNTISANQLIYSHTFWIGLKAAKTSEELYQYITANTVDEILYQTASLYYNILIYEENLKNIDDNLERLNKIYAINEARYNNDLIKRVDLDRVDVSRNELKANRTVYVSQIDALYNNLKILMGIPADTKLKLESSAYNSAKMAANREATTSFNVNNLSSHQVLLNKEELMTLQLTAEKSKRYPTLVAFANYNKTSQADGYNTLTDSDMWSNSSAVGLKLTIPIFNGFSINTKVKKAKLELRNTQLDVNESEKQSKLEFENAVNNLTANWEAYRAKVANSNLAQRVFDQSLAIYQESMISLTDLLDAESNLFEATTKLAEQQLRYHIAELDLLKAKGEIQSLVK